MTKDKNQEKTEKNVFALREEEILDFWDEAKTFEKSVNKDAPKGDYVFYDGPPFGTGVPHYGHILSSVAKDVVPRYWTMQGYRVERRWGWDCHGLPIENIIEKDMGISGKKQIERVGVDKFNEACRARVLEYADVWDVMVRRIARWVDFKNSYKTMDPDFMESVWWAFKEMWNKDLVYEGRRVLLYCPRCETPISNFEVAMDNSYQDITEASVFVKFKIDKEVSSSIDSDVLKDTMNYNIFVLAWTTTPWTLPGNVALAVGEDIEYVMIQIDEEYFILAKERLADVMKEYDYNVVKEFKGSEIVGLEYEPLYDIPAIRESGKKAYYIAAADFITTDEGTGIVHTAVVYGEDDYRLGQKLDLPIVPALDEKGFFNDTVPQFKGTYFKKADEDIITDLSERGLLLYKKDHTHSYPFCHRCNTQLFYNAIPAWFFDIDKLRPALLKQNEKINWYPKHLKNGRFKMGIEQAPDWNISRNRYFATPIPIWECEKCREREIIGSIKELEEKSGQSGIKDIHNHLVDPLTWTCGKCGGTMRRISEVFDCWVESGSMSFAQHHYPFENKEKFEKNFPAQFITEYISQTRAWFYVMHVMSTALFDSNSFENVVTTGVVLNDKGEKMSKSKNNFPDPWKVINAYGVDALRFYLMSSSIMHAENLFFNERELKDVFRKNVMLVYNILSFYKMFAGERKAVDEEITAVNILDKWILARLNELILTVTKEMNNYDLPRASRPLTEFINDFSTWYIRRSRERFKGADETDKKMAIAVTGVTLLRLAKVMAPFMPFMAERIWQEVSGYNFQDNDQSVHLEKWPKATAVDEELLSAMAVARNIVELGLSKRDEAGIKVRQPLQKMQVKQKDNPLRDKEDYWPLILAEVNIKEIEFVDIGDKLAVEVDTELSPELKMEGLKREITRLVNGMRKKVRLTIDDRVNIFWQSKEEDIKKVFAEFGTNIANDTLAVDIQEGIPAGVDIEKEVKVNGLDVKLAIKKA